MKPFKYYSFLGIVSLLLSAGCSPYVENNLIEEIAPVVFWSVDEGEQGKLKMSTLVPPLIQEKKRLLTMEVDLLKQGGKEFNLNYYRELKLGQLRMLLINEKLAKKEGIEKLINTVLIDPDISQRLYLLIVQGNFDDYITSQLIKQENQDYFLYRMLKHYEEHQQGEMSIVNLHQFMKKLYSPLKDPFLPVFQVNQDNFKYIGTALFRKDKEVGIIKDMDDQIFQLLGNDRFLKIFALPKFSISLGRIRSHVHMDVNKDLTALTLKVKFRGRIEEYQGDINLQSEEELKHLTEEIEAYLEKQTSDLLEKMQQWRADPLDIGTLSLHPFAKEITEEQWLNAWENMKINVDYNLEFHPLLNIKE